MNRRPLLVWLLTFALVLQGLSARAIMVGCSMGSDQAACSKWTNPSQKKCCCQSSPMAGMACCQPNRDSGTIKAGFKDACKCEFAQLARPVQTVHADWTAAIIFITLGIAPDPLSFPTVRADTDPWTLGSDSSPPLRVLASSAYSRAPPVMAV